METLPQLPEGLSAGWVLVGMAIVAVGVGAWRAWKFFSPAVKAERDEEAKRITRTKRRLGRAYEHDETAMSHIYSERQRARLFNDRQPSDAERFEIGELPPILQRDVRTYAAEGETDD